ncbi:MAG TPA: 3-deoxy-manno-octulosonate cytidylyltransferase [Holophaga sp.]|jgi:3-deoxy-manno-octulosonate cytidylyltransferase (CMP-KDO synthetase)|nr:3-deoxy-manno-octulosonate cytidylyltransferase [Holophaga sp.]
MKTLAVLPSRYASSRFPGKPLTPILGKPMIQWVWEAARRAPGVDRVVVATDDARIQSAVQAFGGEALMTNPALPSGTDRAAAALALLDEPFDVIVNIQGDEPTMHPETVGALVALMKDQPELELGTVACPFQSADEIFNPNIVKVVIDDRQRALYFSRSPIPYVRNASDFSLDFRPWLDPEQLKHFRRHLGLYAYRPDALKAFMQLPPHPLEKLEMLEQLRALGSGMAMGVAHTPHISLGVDTPGDVAIVEAVLRQQI